MTAKAAGAPPPAADEPTLFALSSGAPPAAIAIVRISGAQAAAALAALAGDLPAPRRATLRALHGPDGMLLDRALVLWLPGPATATGEDLAELHLHGGRAVVGAVLAALAVLPGLVPAPPGGFTRRAFENGRIDLTEAEGLADLLAADSEQQRRQAMQLAEGGLGRLLDGWRERLLEIAAMIEAAIDYDDEGDVHDAMVEPALAALGAAIDDALTAPPAERLRDGVRVVLAGPVNAGKSSLLNALAGRDAAIVSDIGGTTRDLVEVPIQLGGLPIVLTDSAGLRDADDPIERQGIERAEAAVESADLVLWLGDPATAPRDDAILIAAKCDLLPRVSPDILPVSAVTQAGLKELRAVIVQRTNAMLGATEKVALSIRHRRLIKSLREETQQAWRADDILLRAEHLRRALVLIDQILGRSNVEDMLDVLFARFCVGK